MDVTRNKIYLSDSPFYLDISTIVSQAIKEYLNTSWLTQMFVQPQVPILEKLKKQDPEEDKKVEKLQQELFEQKMIIEALKKQMAEMKEEKKVREEAQARRSETFEETVKKKS